MAGKGKCACIKSEVIAALQEKYVCWSSGACQPAREEISFSPSTIQIHPRYGHSLGQNSWTSWKSPLVKVILWIGVWDMKDDCPLQYSCLENSMDRRSWQATVHWIAKSWTQLLALVEIFFNWYHLLNISLFLGFLLPSHLVLKRITFLYVCNSLPLCFPVAVKMIILIHAYKRYGSPCRRRWFEGAIILWKVFVLCSLNKAFFYYEMNESHGF